MYASNLSYLQEVEEEEEKLDENDPASIPIVDDQEGLEKHIKKMRKTQKKDNKDELKCTLWKRDSLLDDD